MANLTNKGISFPSFFDNREVSGVQAGTANV